MKKHFLTTWALAATLAAPLWAQPAGYATPQAALEAMMAALNEADRAALLDVFGAEAEDYLSDDDPVEDRINRLTLLALYSEGYRLVPQDDGSVMISLGKEDWLFPVPLARGADAEWSFDNAAGREEVRLREIGRNELDVVALMAAYVEIQSDFRRVDHDADGVMEFARQIISTSNEERDGLFWAAEDTLLGELFARASALGYNDGIEDQPPEPFSGYYFRILTGQGDAAPGGEMAYLIGDNMVAGHALLAVPAVFGETGVHSFMVSENGIVFEAVLGENTLDIAAELTVYNPTEEWVPFE